MRAARCAEATEPGEPVGSRERNEFPPGHEKSDHIVSMKKSTIINSATGFLIHEHFSD